MRRIAVAALLAAASAMPAEAAIVDVWNVMTGNPYGTRLSVEDLRFADGTVDATPRLVGRGIRLGEQSVDSFVLLALTGSTGLAFGIQCDPAPTYVRIDVENPWTVVPSAGCRVVRRGTVEPGAIRWE
ncbi:MAG: hypothetical protein AB7O45_07900 [Alphaproteobacteria bacterium]